MADYIDRGALAEQLRTIMERYFAQGRVEVAEDYNWAITVLDSAPAADVVPVVHGEWLRADDDWNSLTTIQCSLCGEEWCFETDDDVSLLNYKYCPNCGAKMDGGDGSAAD